MSREVRVLRARGERWWQLPYMVHTGNEYPFGRIVSVHATERGALRKARRIAKKESGRVTGPDGYPALIERVK